MGSDAASTALLQILIRRCLTGSGTRLDDNVWHMNPTNASDIFSPFGDSLEECFNFFVFIQGFERPYQSAAVYIGWQSQSELFSCLLHPVEKPSVILVPQSAKMYPYCATAAVECCEPFEGLEDQAK
jgi:hypothetical protein